MFYNIHTHRSHPAPNTLEILSLYQDFSVAGGEGCFSAGLHPWYLSGWEQRLEALNGAAILPNLLAIGECGLDRLCGTDWLLQQSVFEAQIELANKVQKPLVIHCVRAFDEVLGILNRSKVEVPVIFHGFNNKPAVAKRLLDAGCYLSFGAAILGATAAALVLPEVPEEKIFLETDDSPVTITEIYQKTAWLRNTSGEALILQIEHNFRTVFHK